MVGGYNKGRHVERCVAVAWGTALAKPWQARPILEAMRDQGCRQVQGYSGSSRAGINLQFAFGSFKAVFVRTGVGQRALCLAAAIALSGEDRSGGAFAAISECAACSTMRQPRRMDSTYAAGCKPRAGLSVSPHWTLGLAAGPRARGLLGAGPEVVLASCGACHAHGHCAPCAWAHCACHVWMGSVLAPRSVLWDTLSREPRSEGF